MAGDTKKENAHTPPKKSDPPASETRRRKDGERTKNCMMEHSTKGPVLVMRHSPRGEPPSDRCFRYHGPLQQRGSPCYPTSWRACDRGTTSIPPMRGSHDTRKARRGSLPYPS